MMARAFVISLLLLLAPLAWANSSVLEIKAGDETFRIPTHDFPADRLERVRKFLDEVALLDWEKSTPLHDELFGGKANGRTYLRYIQNHSAGFSYNERVRQMMTHRPPASASGYWLKKKLLGFLDPYPRTVVLGHEAFAKDVLSDQEFMQMLHNLLRGSRMVNRWTQTPCSTESSELSDLLPREGIRGSDSCDSDPGGPASLSLLFAMTVQLNRPELEIGINSGLAASQLTGEARKRLRAEVDASSLRAQIARTLVIMSLGNGVVDFRLCPPPPNGATKVAFSVEVCTSMTDQKGFNLLRDSQLSFTTSNMVNETQMDEILTAVGMIVQERPGTYHMLVIQNEIARALAKREIEL